MMTTIKTATLMLCALVVVACGSGVGESTASASGSGAAAKVAGTSAGAAATDPLPDWFPQNIYRPADFQVTEARRIGQNTHFLAGESAESADALLDAYQSRLKEAGYEVMNSEDLRAQHLVSFKGHGWDESGVRIVDNGGTRRIELSLARLVD